MFYKDNLDFKNHINVILKNNLEPTDNLFAKKNWGATLTTRKNDRNKINELNYKIVSLTNENDTLKQENKTFFKNNRTNSKRNCQRGTIVLSTK